MPEQLKLEPTESNEVLTTCRSCGQVIVVWHEDKFGDAYSEFVDKRRRCWRCAGAKKV